MTSRLWRCFVYSALLSTQSGYAQSPARIILPANLTVAPSQSAPLPVTLAAAAPSDGVFLSLTSSDPSTVIVAPANIFIPQGATAVSRAPTVTGINAGSAIITATANGVTPASVLVQVTAGATMNFSPGSLTISGTTTQNLTLILSAPAPAGGLTVNLNSSDPGKATVPATVSLGANTSSVAVPVMGVAAGSATITASAAGFPNATAAVTVTSLMAISVPANTTVGLGQPVALAVTLPAPAPAAGVTITLNSSDTSKVTVTPSVFIVGGTIAPATQPQVNGINLGSAIVSATAPGYTPGIGQIQVVTGGGSSFFSPANLTIHAGSAQNLTLNLSGSAPGGLTASLSSSNTGVATVPATVTFAAGATSVNVPVTSVAQGSATITASTPNFGNATANVTVPGATQAGIILPANMTVAPGQSTPFPVTLGTAAPSDGVFLSLISSDTSKVTVAPDYVFISQGATAPGRSPTVTGIGAGTAIITASASGFTPASAPVISGSGSGSSATMSFSPGSLTINGTTTQNSTLILSAPAPPGGQSINLSSSNTGVATIPPTVAVLANTTSASVPVTGVAAGSATITATATGLPNATASVTVTPLAAITLPANTTVGLGQSVTLPVTLPGAAPAGGVTVTLNSSDTSKAIVTPSVFIAGGTTSPATQPQVTGISVGLVSIRASAPGYTQGSGQVQVITSGGSSFFSPQSLAINSGSAGSLTLNLSGPAMAGLTASLSSNNTGVATMPATVTFAAGATSVAVPVTGVAAGSATITANTLNFGNASANVTVSASSSGIILAANVIVPLGLSTSLPVTLATAAPSGGVFLSLASSDPSTVNVAPADIFIPQGGMTPSRAPTLNGINLGSAIITASASGFAPASAQVQVGSGGGMSAINLPANTTVGMGQAVMLPVTLPAPAPSGGVIVLLTSSDISKVTVTPSVFIAAGTTSPAAQSQVNGVTLGSAMISALAPGYMPGSGQVQTVTGGGSSFFSPASLTIGANSAQNFTLNLSGIAPAGGLTASLSSSNTGVATVPATVTFAAGASSVSVTVAGVAQGSATITASTPNFGTATANVTVSPSQGISVTWYGACWQSLTLYGVPGNFQAIDYDMTTPNPVTIQGSLFFAANCDPSQGVDNMNDFGTLTGSGHRIIGFSLHPDVIPTSAVYWVGPRTADGMCAPGSPCSGCVNYNKATPDCGSLP
jgi:trimeric autotransporter adhesin